VVVVEGGLLLHSATFQDVVVVVVAVLLQVEVVEVATRSLEVAVVVEAHLRGLVEVGKEHPGFSGARLVQKHHFRILPSGR